MKFTFLFLIPCLCFGSCGTGDILLSMFPTSEWIMANDDFSKIRWLSTSIAKPSDKTITDAISACQKKESDDKTAKDQAKLILKDTKSTDSQKMDAIIKILDVK